MKAVGYRGTRNVSAKKTIIVAEKQEFADKLLRALLKECGHKFEAWPDWFEQITLEIEE